MSFTYVIDFRQYGQGLLVEARRAAAVRDTVAGAGVGEVVCSRRPKESWERGKRVPHGSFIANLLRRQGHDPFAYPDDLARQARDTITSETQRAIERAWAEQRSEQDTVRAALLRAAEILATGTQERLRTGALGQSTGGYAKQKKRLVARGRGTADYGDPPPVGVLSGRFAAGIRARWRLGRRGATSPGGGDA